MKRDWGAEGRNLSREVEKVHRSADSYSAETWQKQSQGSALQKNQ